MKWVDNAYADQFKGYDWKSEEDAFMDGYHNNTGKIVTYERLRAMGNNGVQEPVVDFKDGKLIGTKRLFADGKFGGKDGKAELHGCRDGAGFRLPERHQQKDKFTVSSSIMAVPTLSGKTPSLIRTTILSWTGCPIPISRFLSEDMTELGLHKAILSKSLTTTAQPRPWPILRQRLSKGETFMLFGFPTGVQGNVINAGVNELILPNYKQTWANIRKIAAAPEGVKHLTFKSPGVFASK